MSKKLSDSQIRALRSARDHGNPTYHLRGASEWGGWNGTRLALMRAGLLTESGYLTTEGEKVADNLACAR